MKRPKNNVFATAIPAITPGGDAAMSDVYFDREQVASPRSNSPNNTIFDIGIVLLIF